MRTVHTDMKGPFKYFLYLFSALLVGCTSSEHPEEILLSRQPDRIEKVDDSTVCHSYTLSDNEKEMFYLSKGDTTTHVIVFVTEFYSNYVFFNKDKKISKIKQYLQPVGIRERINEIVRFTPQGAIDTTNSHLLTFFDLGDSIRLHADNYYAFDKTRVLIGDSNIFERSAWKNPDMFESTSSYLTISKSVKGRKCVFQRITTDEKGRDQSGYDIYFDVENLICRDIYTSLVCRTK